MVVKALLEDVRRACEDGCCEEAVDLLERAVREQPSNYELYYWLGICHSTGCRRHKLADPDFALEYFHRALNLVPEADGLPRATILEEIANTCLSSRAVPHITAVWTAIECQRQAAEIYVGHSRLDDWARQEFNLGNAFCDLSDLCGEDHWQEAIFHYQEALKIRTREHCPERYAAVLENLGTAYRQLPTGDHAGNLRISISCYRRALRAYGAGQPARNAALHINLGNAFLSLPAAGAKENARNARHALMHFDRALSAPGSNRQDRQYAINQHNRAQAHLRLANLEEAMDCLQEAYRVFVACGDELYAERVKSEFASIHRLTRGCVSPAKAEIQGGCPGKGP
jgi:tetratricopeptide (TPR) repeat protein